MAELNDHELKDITSAWSTMKDELARLEKQQKAYGDGNTETKAKLDELHGAIESIEEKMADVETKLARPSGGDSDPKAREEKCERLVTKAMADFIRKGGTSKYGDFIRADASDAGRELKTLASERELKALATDQETEGGIWVPRNVDMNLIPYLREMDDVWNVCRVESISKGDTWEAVLENSDTFTTTKTTERASRSETATPGVRAIAIKAHERYALPYVTQKMLDDAEYDVVGWVTSRANEQMAIEAAADFIAGSGDNEPFGIVTRIGTGNNVVATVDSGHATLIKADGLIELVDDTPERYLNGANFLMARQTKRVIRQLKDGVGNYLWERSFSAGKPSTLLDYPIRLAPSLATPTAGAYTGSTYPVLFGNFKEGYCIVRRMGVQMLRDPYSAKPYVQLYFTYRIGGDVLNNAAIKALKISA